MEIHETIMFIHIVVYTYTNTCTNIYGERRISNVHDDQM